MYVTGNFQLFHGIVGIDTAFGRLPCYNVFVMAGNLIAFYCPIQLIIVGLPAFFSCTDSVII